MSRDRLGVKPLYYYSEDNQFVFSSEIKAIISHENLKIDCSDNISKESVQLYFSLGYIPAPHSIYKNIFKLEAATNMKVELKSGKIISKYSFFDYPEVDQCSNRDHLIEEGAYLFKDAVRLRMRSDVPVGAFLSGGLDSTSVVGEMAKFTDLNRLHTFSIGFDDENYDETKYINIAKNFFHTNHHHHVFSKYDYTTSMSKYAKYFDEPFGDYSALAGFKVSEIARENTTVVLCGDGGDEIFGGYPIYNAGHLFDKIKLLPLSIRVLLHNVLKSFSNSNIKIKKAAELINLTLQPSNTFYSTMYNSERYKPETYKSWTSDKLDFAINISNNSMSEALRIYDLLFNTLSNNYLVKVDRTSMSSSIEVRSPFLDYRFIEFAQKVPPHLKVNATDTKILMKDIIKDSIPSEILNRTKMGFTPPIHKWIYDLLTPDNFNSYIKYIEDFDSELVNYYKNIYYSKEFNKIKEYELIKLIIFSNWYEFWIGKKNLTS